MAPCTCQAQKAVRNQSKGSLEASHVLLGQSTNPDILSRVNATGQGTINMNQPKSNLTGGFDMPESDVTNFHKKVIGNTPYPLKCYITAGMFT